MSDVEMFKTEIIGLDFLKRKLEIFSLAVIMLVEFLLPLGNYTIVWLVGTFLFVWIILFYLV